MKSVRIEVYVRRYGNLLDELRAQLANDMDDALYAHVAQAATVVFNQVYINIQPTVRTQLRHVDNVRV